MSTMMRMVFDTNVLIDGFQDDFNAAARLIDAASDGELIALVTPKVMNEYHLLMKRLIDNDTYTDKINSFLGQTEEVEAVRVDTTIDDDEDYKFLQAAVGGQADLLVTNDRHLLDVGEIETTRIVTPQEAWNRFEDESGQSSEWQNFVTGLGIGK